MSIATCSHLFFSTRAATLLRLKMSPTHSTSATLRTENIVMFFMQCVQEVLGNQDVFTQSCTNCNSVCALCQILSSYPKKNSFNKYLSLPPRCRKWIEAQAAQYITTLATRQVLTSSEPDFRLTASQELHYKQTMRGILNRAQTGHVKHPAAATTKEQTSAQLEVALQRPFQAKVKTKTKTLHSLSEIIRKHILQWENRKSDLGHGKKDLTRQLPPRSGTKSCTVDHIRHCGGHWKCKQEGTVVSSVQEWSPQIRFLLKGAQISAFQLKG